MHVISPATSRVILSILIASACRNANAQDAATASHAAPVDAHAAEHAPPISLEYDRFRTTCPVKGRPETVVHGFQELDDGSITERIAGIVGVNLWRAFTVSFDFQAQSMTVMVGSHSPSASPDMITLPLKEKGDERYYAPVQDLQGQTVDFFLDTGNPLSELPQKDVARFGARSTSTVRGVRGMGIGPHTETLALLDTLHLGSATTPQVEVSVPPARVSSIEATLGMNVLSRYRVTIDFPGNKVYLEPAANSQMQAGAIPESPSPRVAALR